MRVVDVADAGGDGSVGRPGVAVVGGKGDAENVLAIGESSVGEEEVVAAEVDGTGVGARCDGLFWTSEGERWGTPGSENGRWDGESGSDES